MNEKIKKWLAGKQDYNEGLALLEEYGNNSNMLKQLQTGRRINMKPYLVAELKKLSRTNVTASRAKQSVKSFRKPVIKRPAPKKVSVNKEYAEVVAYRKQRFVEMAKLRNSLVDMQTDAERAEAIDTIEGLQIENQSLWEDLDYYDKNARWKHGKNPLLFEGIKPMTEGDPHFIPQKTDTEKLLAKAEWEKLRKRIGRAEKTLLKIETSDGKESAKYLKKEKDLNVMYAEKDALFKKLGK